MKLYGAHPKDTCPWGCCGKLAPAWKHTKAVRAARKVAKKRARREGRALAGE
jgi:hypothetical protein